MRRSLLVPLVIAGLAAPALAGGRDRPVRPVRPGGRDVDAAHVRIPRVGIDSRPGAPTTKLVLTERNELGAAIRTTEIVGGDVQTMARVGGLDLRAHTFVREDGSVATSFEEYDGSLDSLIGPRAGGVIERGGSVRVGLPLRPLDERQPGVVREPLGEGEPPGYRLRRVDRRGRIRTTDVHTHGGVAIATVSRERSASGRLLRSSRSDLVRGKSWWTGHGHDGAVLASGFRLIPATAAPAR
jgi:hypothetical protein